MDCCLAGVFVEFHLNGLLFGWCFVKVLSQQIVVWVVFGRVPLKWTDTWLVVLVQFRLYRLLFG